MVTFSRKIENLDDLRAYINKVLCDQEQLVLGAFQMTERMLTRSGKPCGMYFCVHGPRSVKISAVWDALSNAVLFYGSSGERFHKLLLDEELQLELQTA
jgi:hypothetical protein